MDRVIPKDVIDLIYKESHLDNTKRLNTEYHNLFLLTKSFDYDVLRCKAYTHELHYINNRDNNRYYYDDMIWNFKRNRIIVKLPKTYAYSSGHSKLKWIE